MNIAIITGASSGIGKEFVLQIAKKYSHLDELWIIARRAERLNDLASSLKSTVKILPLDLTSDSDLAELTKQLKTVRPNIQILVNCAGCGKIGSFEQSTYQEALCMIDINCKALTAITYMALPYMKSNARIIEIASSAAFLPQPEFAVYAATKAYVLSFSRALKYELQSRHIHVTAVCPGPVDTEFFDVADPADHGKQYKKIFRVKPERVVAKALKESALGDELSIYGWPMKFVFACSKTLPHKLILKIVYGRNSHV